MNLYTLALFGEAERGEFCKPYLCDSVAQLLDVFGQPPKSSQGIYYAIQSILYHQHLIFCRVQEEGFSREDYFIGLDFLRQRKDMGHLSAICLPGVGDAAILDAIVPICHLYRSLLITNEADFYDYLTESQGK